MSSDRTLILGRRSHSHPHQHSHPQKNDRTHIPTSTDIRKRAIALSSIENTIAITGILANTIAIRAVGGSHLTTNHPVGAGLAKNGGNNRQFWHKTRPYQCDRHH